MTVSGMPVSGSRPDALTIWSNDVSMSIVSRSPYTASSGGTAETMSA